ncbi:hypothetical protein KCP70_02790 [Salmonella enterica subsp. enterica]|nr:hypothetical protein KCP70_02790 [Salmonella enterica subsp. enterica]
MLSELFRINGHHACLDLCWDVGAMTPVFLPLPTGEKSATGGSHYRFPYAPRLVPHRRRARRRAVCGMSPAARFASGCRRLVAYESRAA